MANTRARSNASTLFCVAKTTPHPLVARTIPPMAIRLVAATHGTTICQGQGTFESRKRRCFRFALAAPASLGEDKVAKNVRQQQQQHLVSPRCLVTNQTPQQFSFALRSRRDRLPPRVGSPWIGRSASQRGCAAQPPLGCGRRASSPAGGPSACPLPRTPPPNRKSNKKPM